VARPGKASLEVIEGGKGLDRRATLQELYSKYGGSVYGRCQYLLKDRNKAEDAMQDVFAKAISNYSEFRAEASPLAWLMTIATHHCLNLIRGERSWRKAFEEVRQVKTEAQQSPHAMELREAVRNLLSKFDLETQAAAIHYHVDEMTLEEVAAVLKRSVPTVRKRLQQFARGSGQEWNS
jgi:RNA polymerase sigma-70 factor (ECF subfamily)